MSRSIFDSDADEPMENEENTSMSFNFGNDDEEMSEHDEQGSEDEPEQPSTPPRKQRTRKGGNRSAKKSAPAKKRPKLNYAEYLRGKPFIPLAKVHRYLHDTYSFRVSRRATATLVGVVQGLLADLLNEVKTQIENQKTRRISAKTICMAIQQDPEFPQLFVNVVIPETGIFGVFNSSTHGPTVQST